MAAVVIRFFTDFTDKPLSMGYCFLVGIVFDAMFVVYRKLRKRILNILDNH
jgi:cell shape-determining protein MreD